MRVVVSHLYRYDRHCYGAYEPSSQLTMRNNQQANIAVIKTAPFQNFSYLLRSGALTNHSRNRSLNVPTELRYCLGAITLIIEID